MKKIISAFIVLLVFTYPRTALAQFEKAKDSVIQLVGVVMTADSLEGIPDVNIIIKGTNRGTVSNPQGVFSLAVLKGDVIEFSHVSFNSSEAVIPRNLDKKEYSMIKTLVADTTYLPVVVIRPRPTPEQFARDFANLKIAEDQAEILRKNNTYEMQQKSLRKITMDGREMSGSVLRTNADRARYQGQLPPMNIFNPAAWGEFIKAWKRGDFKRK